MNHLFQNIIRKIEAGEVGMITRVFPLVFTIVIIGVLFDAGPFPLPIGSVGGIFHGLNDAQSMDNAQLARQLFRKQGFTTEFLRPYAVTQIQNYAVSRGLSDNLFPPTVYTAGVPRILPDTYNAPAYPCLLAAWFYLVRPNFDESPKDIATHHIYSGDMLIPVLNQIFLLLTTGLVFLLGWRLFDERVAWMSLVAFLTTNLLWGFSVTALSTTFLMFLLTAILFCALEIFHISEACQRDENHSFTPAWFWTLGLAFLLGLACLTRLQLLVLLVPLFLLLLLMPRSHPLLFLTVALISAGMVAPWLWHFYRISGNPLGSTMTYLLVGSTGYEGNQIFCATSIPTYEAYFRSASQKEYRGFLWQFEHCWILLGSNPMVLLFGASLLHRFKQSGPRMLQWLLAGFALFLIALNNLGVNNPDPLSPWNVLVLLLPCLVVIGTAFFFILLDRQNLIMRLLKNLIITVTLLLTALPLLLALTQGDPQLTSFPPYWPPYLKSIGQMAQPDEWVTTDMPWATAWYGDRPSLWLPDSLQAFENFHDNLCPSGVLLLTPVTWQKPVANLMSGEDKDWLPLFVNTPPADFPLSAHTFTAPHGPDYSLWSDRPRWESH
jgi:4-amino-4-deoxy-L-arabinose transferase-like glycosyltransferase